MSVTSVEGHIHPAIVRVVEWFGLRVRLGACPEKVGHPPTHVMFDREGVVWIDDGSCLAGDVLHECIHAVLGPYTLTEESGLMAYEYACARLLLSGEDWTEWRRDFADYGFDWGDGETEIGDRDEVFESSEWIDHCQMDASMRGWLQDTGAPVQFRGVHEGYLRPEVIETSAHGVHVFVDIKKDDIVEVWSGAAHGRYDAD